MRIQDPPKEDDDEDEEESQDPFADSQRGKDDPQVEEQLQRPQDVRVKALLKDLLDASHKYFGNLLQGLQEQVDNLFYRSKRRQ